MNIERCAMLKMIIKRRKKLQFLYMILIWQILWHTHFIYWQAAKKMYLCPERSLIKSISKLLRLYFIIHSLSLRSWLVWLLDLKMDLKMILLGICDTVHVDLVSLPLSVSKLSFFFCLDFESFKLYLTFSNLIFIRK